MKRNPVLMLNSVAGLVSAAIILLAAFGFELTVEQVGAIGGFVAAAGAVIGALLGQAQVDSPETVERKVLEGIELGRAESTGTLLEVTPIEGHVGLGDEVVDRIAAAVAAKVKPSRTRASGSKGHFDVAVVALIIAVLVVGFLIGIWADPGPVDL